MMINADNRQTAAVTAMLAYLEKGVCRKRTVFWQSST